MTGTVHLGDSLTLVPGRPNIDVLVVHDQFPPLC